MRKINFIYSLWWFAAAMLMFMMSVKLVDVRKLACGIVCLVNSSFQLWIALEGENK